MEDKPFLGSGFYFKPFDKGLAEKWTEQGHVWKLTAWREPKTYLTYFERKCETCHYAERVGYDDCWLNKHPMTKYQLFESFSSPKTPLCDNSGEELVQSLRTIISGLNSKTKFPCECEGSDQVISNVIIHLNDHHGWTREKIADWLDTLDIDLSFQMNDVD